MEPKTRGRRGFGGRRYPGSYNKGEVIDGLEQASKLEGKIFHAGTTLEAGQVLTNGGRVLCATALGQSVTEAQQNAYALAQCIQWPGVNMRKDIAYRAIERETHSS